MSIRYYYEVICNVCWETWEADDYATAVADLEVHLENDHWGHITEMSVEEEEPNKEDQYDALL